MASKGLEDSRWVHKLHRCPFASTALENLVFEVQTMKFAKRTLATKSEKQSSAWAPSPPNIGNLQASSHAGHLNASRDLPLGEEARASSIAKLKRAP
jgi:hypothetical protein